MMETRGHGIEEVDAMRESTVWRSLTSRWRATPHVWLVDAAIAVAVFVAAVVGVNLADPDGVHPGSLLTAEALVLIASASLPFVRKFSPVVVAITTLCIVVLGILGYVLTPLLLAPLMVALFRFAAEHAARVSWWTAAVVSVLVIAAAVGGQIDTTVVIRTLGPALWVVLPVVLGTQSRLNAMYLAAVHTRADTAELTRESEARARVAEERVRIARDLHDVVAHHMTVANAQAGTALHLLDANPDVARDLLGKLQKSTATAIVEMRDIVRVLRTPEDEPDDDLRSAPGLAQLPDLLTAAADAGVRVDLAVEGEPIELAPGTDLTAYRIIQEALTNAAKHADSAQASLRLRYARDHLTITVDNAVVGTPTRASGFGLVGMRERAQSVGGELRAGRLPDNGFHVVASLPITTPEQMPPVRRPGRETTP
ncbi:sensor histidine kinase [Gordonia sp. VNK1]|uniref:sensor histidine kinase n=1 Tax=Gordonia oleivorans TaxID=3156618 RepID=UPI0032B3210A